MLYDLDHGKLGVGDVECDANSDFLNMVDTEEEEDDSLFPSWQSRPSGAADVIPPVDSDLYEVYKRAVAPKQLLLAVPTCMMEMSHYLPSPFKSMLPPIGGSMLKIHGMSELGLAKPPAVEPSVPYHLHPNRRLVSVFFQHFSPW